MLAASHMIAGAAVAKTCPRAAIAVPVAFISHFVLDMVPHSSFHMLPHAAESGPAWWGAALDVAAIGFLLILTRRMRERWVMLGAAFAAALPDLLDYVSPVADWFHAVPGTSYVTWVHNVLHVDVSSTYWMLGFITQIILVAGGLYVVLRNSRKNTENRIDNNHP